jgi:uncharacterized damage-inducible protein DinB
VDRSEMQLLVGHLQCADRRVLHTLEGLPLEVWTKEVPSSYGSVLATVAHLLGAEWTWLERLQGRSPAQVGPERIEAPAQLIDLWPMVWSGWQKVASEFPPDFMSGYQTTSGKKHRSSLSHILLHVCMHSATYRGQVTAIQRSLGLPTANTDFITYIREEYEGTDMP